MTYILFIIGFFLLIKGADILVDGASSIAKKFRISEIVIGLTIVAFGTSMPELFVNLFAAFNGDTDIAIGNIVGSNIANILLILGICATIAPLTVLSNTTWKEIPMGLLAMVIIGLMANDIFIDGGTANTIGRIDGMILLSFFIIFLYYTFGIAKRDANYTNKLEMEDPADTQHKMSTSTFMIIGGLIGLTLGGKWIVDGATAIAAIFGLSQALIGLTIVAVGTSLPELATSAVAAYKGKSDIAVGNIAGSNIFNIFWILGVSAIIQPLPFNSLLNFDIVVGIAASLLLFVAVFLGKRFTIERSQGVMFIILYVLYIIFLVLRG
jgi:cation:H+ antiporter